MRDWVGEWGRGCVTYNARSEVNCPDEYYLIFHFWRQDGAPRSSLVKGKRQAKFKGGIDY